LIKHLSVYRMTMMELVVPPLPPSTAPLSE
jgi:hypothetical protein